MPNKLAFGSGTFPQRLLALLLAMVIALQSGCVSHSSRPDLPQETGMPVTQFQSELGKVAIVASESMLGAAPESVANGTNGDTASQRKKAFNSCVIPLTCDGDICAALVLSEVVICGLTALSGSEKVSSAKEANKLDLKVAMEAAVGPNIIQDTLRNQVVADAKADGVRLVKVPSANAQRAAQDNDYPPLATLGVDTVLEVSMIQIFGESEGEESNPVLPLDMQAHIRLIKTGDNNEVFSGDYFYRGKQLKYSEWSANNAERLAQAMKAGYESIARDISDRVFQLYPFPAPLTQEQPVSCGLEPIDLKQGAGGLQPQLSWQSFPRAADIAAAAKEMAQVRNVRYDLIISQGENGESPNVIYRREGLKNTKHKVEIALQPNTRYFWSVRARFKLNGRQRVTEWATRCPFEQQLVVGARLYRFYTPDT